MLCIHILIFSTHTPICSSIHPSPSMDEHTPNPFSSSPSGSGSNTPTRQHSGATSPHKAAQSSALPDLTPSASSSPTFPRSKASSLISAASGSPPPTHRASFPDPSKEPKKGSSKLAGPPAKVGYCCERDKEITLGEEISIIDAYKTTEGGTATYITYVIRLGVSVSPSTMCAGTG